MNDVNINLAGCKLYINNSNVSGRTVTSVNELIFAANLAGRNDSSVANLTTNLDLNSTLGAWVGGINNTAFHWVVQCTNLSSSPTTGTPSFANTFYQDLIFPILKFFQFFLFQN